MRRGDWTQEGASCVGVRIKKHDGTLSVSCELGVSLHCSVCVNWSPVWFQISVEQKRVVS